jgi:exosome complex component RRP42
MIIETPKVNADKIKQYLSEGKRFDHRKLDEYRDLEIEVPVSKNAEGSARVRLGKTEIIVGVKMDIGTPYPDSLDKGNLVVSAEILPLSSKRVELGKPGFDSLELARVIDRGIRESKFIQFEKLCIKEGEKVWNVMVDIYSINDDGNLLDASGIGVLAALKNAKIPEYDEETGKAKSGEWTNKKLPLNDNLPIAITIHKIGDSLFVDPTTEEQDISEARLTIGISDQTISSMQKGEAVALTVEEISEMLDMAEKVWKDLSKKVEKFLK